MIVNSASFTTQQNQWGDKCGVIGTIPSGFLPINNGNIQCVLYRNYMGIALTRIVPTNGEITCYVEAAVGTSCNVSGQITYISAN